MEQLNKKSKKVKDPLNSDKRYTKKYELQLIEYANQSIREDEKNLYDSLYNAVKETNDLKTPQDLMMLDIAIYDFLRIKRIQGIVMKEGDVSTVEFKGRSYTKVNEAGYLLNAVSTQFRNMMKEIGITGKEKLKQRLGVESKDFSNFMSEDIEVEGETVKEND